MRAFKRASKTPHDTCNCLEIISGEDSVEGNRGNFIPLSPTISFGRDPSNTIQILDSTVSNHHAKISLMGNDYIIEDLGSKNGTSVNGEKIDHPQVLRKNDIIRIGMVTLKFLGEK